MVIDVIAAGLHPRVRSQADGSHYTSTGELPLVPGIDGVGRGADGLLRYFILPDTTMGAMAEQTVIDTRRSIVLPDDSDPIAVAAAMNPAMSSWVALRRRVQFQAGHNVLVLGATGNACEMAVQIANLFGADQIIAAGGAAPTVWLACPHSAPPAPCCSRGDADTVAQRLGRAATDVDVVIDYLWGRPHRRRRWRPSSLTAQIAVSRSPGSKSAPSPGPTPRRSPPPRLRAARLQIVGSGQGSRQHQRNPRRTARTRPERTGWLPREITGVSFPLRPAAWRSLRG